MSSKLDFLFHRKDVAGLAVFRILFGLLMFYQVIYYYQIDYTYQLMSGPELRFEYAYWPLSGLLPLSVLRILHHGMLLATILIALGWWYRYAMAYFCIVFTYFSFIDKTLFNNHLYLIALVALVLCFMATDRRYALAKRTIKTVPAWNVYLMRFLIVLVYVYGALAKLSPDWFQGGSNGPVINDLSKIIPESLASFVIIYGGLIFDAVIGFLLLYRPTRLIGVLMVLSFNLMNALVLFDDIGVFPYFMIATLVLFFEPEQVKNFMAKLGFGKEEALSTSGGLQSSNAGKKHKKQQASHQPTVALPKERRSLTLALLGLFVGFQLLWPLRGYLFAGVPEWNGIGSRFAWRMKIQTKAAESFTYTMTDPATGNTNTVDHRSFVSQNQFNHLLEDPIQLVQFAHYLEKLAIERGFSADPVITLDNRISMNGRPAQYWIDPKVDLTKVSTTSLDRSWLLPLKSR